VAQIQLLRGEVQSAKGNFWKDPAHPKTVAPTPVGGEVGGEIPGGVAGKIPKPLMVNEQVAPTDVGKVREDIGALLSKKYKTTLDASLEDEQFNQIKNASPGEIEKRMGFVSNLLDTELAKRWKTIDTYELIANKAVPDKAKDKLIDDAIKDLEDVTKFAVVKVAGADGREGEGLGALSDFFSEVYKATGKDKVIAFDKLINMIHSNDGSVLAANLDMKVGTPVAKAFSEIVLDKLDSLAGGIPKSYYRTEFGKSRYIPKFRELPKPKGVR
jgi:hypothetical protein